MRVVCRDCGGCCREVSSVVDCCADGYNLANPPSVNHAFHINWTAAYGGSGRPVCPVLRAVGCCVPAVTC